MNAVTTLHKNGWIAACHLNDLIPNSGICALFQGQPVAIYYLPEETPSLYALSNWDPIGKASVMSRGILGSIGDALVIASPLYKQHFSLVTGTCLEQPEHCLQSYAVRLVEKNIELRVMP